MFSIGIRIILLTGTQAFTDEAVARGESILNSEIREIAVGSPHATR